MYQRERESGSFRAFAQIRGALVKNIIYTSPYCAAHRFTAAALDVNGTSWIGTFRCRGYDSAGEKVSAFIEGVTMDLVQTGADVTATLDFGGGDISYDRRLIDDARVPTKKGYLSIIHPDTDADASTFNELVWGTITYNAATGRGTWVGKGIRASNPAGGPDSCTWRFKTVP